MATKTKARSKTPPTIPTGLRVANRWMLVKVGLNRSWRPALLKVGGEPIESVFLVTIVCYPASRIMRTESGGQAKRTTGQL